MKTNILYRIFVLPVILLAFTACNESSFLDLVNPNEGTEIDFWRDEADVIAAMATVYSPIRGQMYGYYGAETGWQVQNGRADDTWNKDEGGSMWSLVNFLNQPGTGTNGSIFGRTFYCVHRANTLLANIDDVPMSEEKRNEYKAEALFLRGFAYYLLVINWGEVPLRTVPAEEIEDIMLASSSEEKIWQQIEEDLEFAKKYLPVTRPASEQGRVTKGAAIAFLGKSYVFQSKFKEAVEELGLLMQAPYSYDLTPKFEDNFHQDTEFNEESIFELNYDDFGTNGFWGSEEPNSMQGIALPNYIGSSGTGGWFKVMPSASLADAFMSELRPAGSDTKFDKRMYTSFYFKYSDFGDVKADELFYGDFTFDHLWVTTGGNTEAIDPGYSEYEGVEGRFLVKKYTNWWKQGENANKVDILGNRSNNYRVMRFAEVLMLHAEACAETGDLATAASHLKRIRDRAGLAEKTWSGKDEIMKEIEHQKLLEFFLEGIRFFDLKRWYTPDEMKAIFIKNKKQGAEYFQAKHYYLPIPDDETNTNTKIEQHPLWR